MRSLPRSNSLGESAPTDTYVYRADYGSDLRDSAALVTLAVETRMANVETPKLVNVISKAYLSREYTSTQEQAWMLLAANALADQAKVGKLVVNGAPVQSPLLRSMTAEALAKTTLSVANEGDEPVDAVVTVIGAALTPEPAVSKGFTIERSYYTLDGKPIDLKSATGGNGTVKQNDRFIAVVKIEAKELVAACCSSTGCRPASRSRTRGSSRAATSRRSIGSRPRCGRSTASSATIASWRRST